MNHIVNRLKHHGVDGNNQNYRLKGSYMLKLQEGPGAPIIPVPEPFEGKVNLKGSIRIGSRNYQKVQGELNWTADYFREDFRGQQLFGIMGGWNNLIMVGVPLGKYEPPIYAFLRQEDQPSTYPLGDGQLLTVDPPESSERVFLPGKLFKWSYLSGEKPNDIEALKKEFLTGNGEKYFEVISRKIEELREAAKKDKRKNIETDLDMYVFRY